MSIDPGDCPICGTAHCACIGGEAGIGIPQMPARDAETAAPPPASALSAKTETTFTTKTYSRKKHGRREG